MNLNNVYELMLKEFRIESIAGLIAFWDRIYYWLGSFQWVSRSFENVKAYCTQKGMQ